MLTADARFVFIVCLAAQVTDGQQGSVLLCKFHQQYFKKTVQEGKIIYTLQI